MSETTLLRNNAIVRNASIGATPPHGPVKTGELPLVQVKSAPGGPQVQQGQQKPVEILAPRDAKSAVATGGLPMVSVKMTQNGPQADDGRDNPVLIKDNRPTVAAGSLPMVQVKMENGRPQVKTVPNVQAGPPQIPSAAPVLSAPRVAQAAQSGPRVTRIAAPRPALAAPQVELPPVPDLSVDQLMLCRHLVEKYHQDLVGADQPTEAPDSLADESETAALARMTIAMIDDILVATAVRAEAAALAASAAPAAAAPAFVVPMSNVYVNPRPTTGGHFSPASLAPVPHNTGYVANRPGIRSHGGGARTQGNASLAPRRVQRTAQPGSLPPVIVKMDGQRPVVQQQPADQVPSAPTQNDSVDAQG